MKYLAFHPVCFLLSLMLALVFTLASGTVAPNHHAVAAATGGIGIWRSGGWYLRNSVSTGNPDAVFGFGTSSDIPLMCDWTGNGHKYPVVFRPSTAQWFFGTNATAPAVGLVALFGTTGDIPICGDWTGQGKQTIGVARGSTQFYGHIYLSNSNTAPAVNGSWVYTSNAPDQFVVGDWSGRGGQGNGIDREGDFILWDFDGRAVAQVAFGVAGDIPVTGDWTGQGAETIGIYRNGQWCFSNSNTAPAVAITFGYGGAPGDIPLSTVVKAPSPARKKA